MGKTTTDRLVYSIPEAAAVHANVSVLPAALAMAERVGTVSGRDVITAVAVGVDILCRIALARSEPPNWILSSTAGYFGATVAAGKILGLDESKLLHAMGIAYSQCAGNAQCLVEGSLVKRMQPAFAARAGVLSTLLAEKGITGPNNMFEGQYGFFPLYHRNRYDRQQAIKGLGETFEVKNLSVKLFPGGRFTHGPVEATLSIVSENDIGPDDVEEIIVHVTEAAYNFVGKPFEIRRYPQVDAQFSIPYTVSVATTRRDLSIDDFFEDKIRTDIQVLQLTKKIRVIADQEPMGVVGMTPCVVEIRTKDGKVYAKRVDILRGDPRNPVGIDEISEKFRKCAAFSAKPIPQKNIEQTVKAISQLEKVKSVAEIIKLLA